MVRMIFDSAGLDPSIHVVTGGKKDNFWMMGETGPCGPCSELHLDLTPTGDSKGSLVNADSHLCIEIWNLVFIQFNADRQETSHPLSKTCGHWHGLREGRCCHAVNQGFYRFLKPNLQL